MLVLSRKHFFFKTAPDLQSPRWPHCGKMATESLSRNTCPPPDLLLVDSVSREWQAAYKKCSAAFYISPSNSMRPALSLSMHVFYPSFFQKSYPCLEESISVTSCQILFQLPPIKFTDLCTVQSALPLPPTLGWLQPKPDDAKLLHFTAVRFSSRVHIVIN